MTITVKITGGAELQAAINAVIECVEEGASVVLLAGAEVLAEGVREKIMEQGLYEDGDLYNSVDAQATGAKSAETKAGPLAYTLVHEFGLFAQQITPKQRRFFWAMYSQTGEDMWKALALSQTYTIPARPYFRPGIDENQNKAAQAIADKAAALVTGG